MIDLDKIEAKIDSVLAEETNASLTNWLMNKRNKELNHLLGQGSFISMTTSSLTFCSSQSTFIEQIEGGDVNIDSNSLPFAA